MSKRLVRKIFVVRFHTSLVNAISTPNNCIVALGFVNQANEIEVYNRCDRIKVIPWDFTSSNKLITGLREVLILIDLIKEEKPEIIHVNALQDLIYTFLAVHLCVFGKNRPAIIAMSRDPHTWKNPLKARLIARVVELFADGFVALSFKHKEQLIEFGVSSHKIEVIPNPYEDNLANLVNFSAINKPTLHKRTLRVVYVAHICERKAQDILIQAAKLVLMKHPNVSFDLVGKVVDGEELYAKRIITMIRELNMSEQVHYLGAVPHSRIIDLLEDCDIFTFPSYSEMMPRSVIEAMLVGKPVIASAVDGICDLIQDHKSGILVQPGNVIELAEAIIELIENPSLAIELGLQGHKHILTICSPEVVGNSFRSFYQSILNKVTA